MRDNSGERLPGPGQYNYDKSPVLNKSPGQKWGSSPRDRHGRNASLPGPGHYSHSETLLKAGAHQYSIAKSKRDGPGEGLGGDGGLPGPGYYNLANSPSGPKITIPPGKLRDKPGDTPGPGSYSLESNFVKEKAPGYTMGRTKDRNSYLPKAAGIGKDYVPGPGEYNYNTSAFAGPKFKYATVSITL